MFQVGNKSFQKSYELGSKFKIAIPAQYQMYCVHCQLSIFISFMLINFTDNLEYVVF